MAENYKRHKNKSSKHYRDEDYYKSKLQKRKQNKDAKNELESKTPPLLTKHTSIEELIQQRESLKEKLKSMASHSDAGLEKTHKSNKESKKRKHSKDHSSKEATSKKYVTDSKIKLCKQVYKEASPEYNDYEHMESEDEESIIEQRRKQRKQLLEKYNVSHEKQNNNNKQNTKTVEESISTTIDQVEPLQMKEVTDMFSEKDDFISKATLCHASDSNIENNTQLTDNWDDEDGYYIAREGDIINSNRYYIKHILGQGVFANVVHAQDNSQGNMSVAIKIVRNNDLMYKTSLKEIAILKEINEADPENKYHCVKLLRHFMHKGHLCIVLESLHMDLRRVLKKYGKNHGINVKALMSYSRQLLLALRLLKKVGIVHADIKPDNILVNEKKNVLKLCDFGSATKVNDAEPTPYLVSRFYRAPEIILGLPYKHGIDLWSTACTMYEMATGKILFTGSSNNKMLKCFMDVKGKIPNRLIRKGKFKDQHFNYNNNFLLHKKDEITGKEKIVEVSNISIVRDLYKELKKSCKVLSSGDEKKLIQLKDLLDKMLMLDSNHRLSVIDCIKHPFIQDELQK